MAQMDHNEAIQLQAAVKYVLGELSLVQREEYEEHYFDCAECAIDLKVLATFADTTREVLRQEKSAQLVAASAPASAGWFRWFQPIVAIPAFAALLLIIAYQNMVTIPRAGQQASSTSANIVFNSHPIRGVNTAGEETRTLSIRPGEAFLLDFDFVPTRTFDQYIGQLEDANGRVLLRSSIAGGNANHEAHLPVPARLLRPGKYVLAFYGDPGATGRLNSQNEAGRLSFAVEFRP
jgi:hypothetical protein